MSPWKKILVTELKYNNIILQQVLSITSMACSLRYLVTSNVTVVSQVVWTGACSGYRARPSFIRLQSQTVGAQNRTIKDAVVSSLIITSSSSSIRAQTSSSASRCRLRSFFSFLLLQSWPANMTSRTDTTLQDSSTCELQKQFCPSVPLTDKYRIMFQHRAINF